MRRWGFDALTINHSISMSYTFKFQLLGYNICQYKRINKYASSMIEDVLHHLVFKNGSW